MVIHKAKTKIRARAITKVKPAVKAPEVKVEETEVVVPEEESPEVKEDEVVTIKGETLKPTMYVSKKISLYHPYQKVRFNQGVPTACVEDSWLKSQINANIIEKC